MMHCAINQIYPQQAEKYRLISFHNETILYD